MRATFTIDVDDSWVEARATQSNEDMGANAVFDVVPMSGRDYFASRCQHIAEDELRSAFRGWPVNVNVSLTLE